MGNGIGVRMTPLSGRGWRWGVLLSVTTNSLALSAQEPSLIDIPPPSATLEDRKFSMIRGIRELADGRLLVSDALERSLYVVDFATQSVNRIGRTGDGPNEYQAPGHLYAVGSDSTLLTDETTQRVFLAVGDSIVRTLAAASLAPAIARGAPEGYWGADRFGRILVVEGFAYAPRVIPMSRVYADSVRFLLTENIFADQEVDLHTVAEVGGQGRLGVDRNRQRGGLLYHTSPLAAEGQAWLFQDGWMAVAYPDRIGWIGAHPMDDGYAVRPFHSHLSRSIGRSSASLWRGTTGHKTVAVYRRRHLDGLTMFRLS